MPIRRWTGRRGSGEPHRVFARLFMPYLLFLIVPLALGWILYNKTIDLMSKEATDNQSLVLEQSRAILERRLEEIASIAFQLASDTRIIQFQPVTDPFAGTNTYRVLDTNKSLYDYKLSNNFVHNYYILFKNSDLVLTPGSSYTFDEFATWIAAYPDKDMDSHRDSWLNTYHVRSYLPAADVKLDGVTYSMLTYLQSLGLPGNPQGVIAVFIDQAEIRKLFRGLNLSETGWAYILDDKGRIISNLAGNGQLQPPVDPATLAGSQGVIERSVGSEPMTVTYTKSAVNGWTYVAGQPSEVVLHKVRYIQKTVFSLTLLFLVAGAAIALLLAYRNSKPLRNLIRLIRDFADPGGKHRDAYGLIGDAVNGLVNSNRMMQSELQQQVPLLRASYFRRLMQGQFLSARDADALLKHVGIDLQGIGMTYVVAIVHLYGFDNEYSNDLLEDLDRMRFAATEVLREAIGPDGFAYDVAEDQIAVLVCCSPVMAEHYRERIEAAMQQAAQTIADRHKLGSSCGIGNPSDSLTGVSRSYEQAREAVNALIRRQHEGIQWFDELPAAPNSYYYPQDIEARLMNLAMAGDSEEVSRTLDSIYRENVEGRHLPHPVLRLFLGEMWGSVVKLMPQVGLETDELFATLQGLEATSRSYESMRREFETIRHTYARICDRVNEQRTNRNVQLLDNIQSMLQMTYADKELCLDVAADRLRVSKVYLSQFFKEQTGVNFSDYLERLRMDRAKQLLCTTSMTVQDIAEQVGYHSSNTFCRAFKRLHGVSATVYQRTQR